MTPDRVGKGKSETYSLTAPRGLREDVEARLIEPIRKRSGFYANHSCVTQALLKVALEAVEDIEYEEIQSLDTLVRVLKDAIVRRGKKI
jgi:hypothetical protein